MTDLSSVQRVAASRLALEMRKAQVSAHLPQAVIEQSHLDVESQVAGEVEGLLVSMTTYVLSEHLTGEWVGREVTWSHEWEEWASWWQHTKAVHFPTLARWLRRPPRRCTRVYEERRYVQIHHDRYRTFPDANLYPVPPEQLGRPVIVESWGDIRDEYRSWSQRRWQG